MLILADFSTMSRYRHRHLLSSLESAKSGASGSDKKLIWVVIIVVGCSLLVFVLLMLCLWKKVMPYLQQKWNIKGEFYIKERI